MNNKMKIFLSYHKNTPCYKSEIFQPIQVGTSNSIEKLDFAISDNTGDNISELNPYYCELTGHYWVLKNYLEKCNEDYIGFCHYRRLPDINNISSDNYPSIFGLSYSNSTNFFNNLKLPSLNYDIILPCSVYLYANTVNPLLREDEPHYNMYEQFKTEHKNNLLDSLKSIIKKYYPEYIPSVDKTFAQEKIHCYNMYIMKRNILKEFLEWEFDILSKTGDIIGGWTQPQYLRMAGFVGERLINIWINKNDTYSIGYMPVYMVDFESDYIIKANEYHQKNMYKEEIDVLKQLLSVTNNKFNVLVALATLYQQLSDKKNLLKTLTAAQEFATTSDDFYSLANLYSTTSEQDITVSLYKKSIELSPHDKFYTRNFLDYASRTKDIGIIKQAWDNMLVFELDNEETEKYNHFKKIYEMISGSNK